MPGFRWNEWNAEKVAKHGVSILEAEQVVRSPRRPYPRKIGGGKWQVVGRGQGDRWVQVIYVFEDRTIFVIHAMPVRTRG
jgi:uncharacterized DUF497 family protein